MTLIMVVDDEAAILEMLSLVLQEEGYEVVTASNGLEGLKCLERVLPALVISDVMMPGLDGPELCRHMQADRRFRSIPIVLASAVRTTSHLKGCAYAALLDKPFEIEEMLATIARLVEPTGSS